MSFRETEINFAIWLYPEKKEYFNYVLFSSILLHILFCFLLTYIQNNKAEEIAVTPRNNNPIHIQFTDGKLNKTTPKNNYHEKKLTENIPENKMGGVLTDDNPNSDSKTLIPEELAAKELKPNKQPLVSKRLPQTKDLPPSITNKPNSEKKSEMEQFLPHSNSAYIDELREHYRREPKIEGDSGDIPVIGDDYAPRSGAKIKERYSVRDLSLYQFSLQFKEKFGGIWNSQDRVVPPTSPLRPGDIIYYKIYIKGDGSLYKYENLSQKSSPQKDFAAVDKMIDEVVSKVFPLSLPGRFAKNLVTEIIAIQVVGRNSPVQYSFQ